MANPAPSTNQIRRVRQGCAAGIATAAAGEEGTARERAREGRRHTQAGALEHERELARERRIAAEAAG